MANQVLKRTGVSSQPVLSQNIGNLEKRATSILMSLGEDWNQLTIS